MNRVRHARASDLFLQARDLPLDQRQEFLAAACADDRDPQRQSPRPPVRAASQASMSTGSNSCSSASPYQRRSARSNSELHKTSGLRRSRRWPRNARNK